MLITQDCGRTHARMVASDRVTYKLQHGVDVSSMYVIRESPDSSAIDGRVSRRIHLTLPDDQHLAQFRKRLREQNRQQVESMRFKPRSDNARKTGSTATQRPTVDALDEREVWKMTRGQLCSSTLEAEPWKMARTKRPRRSQDDAVSLESHLFTLFDKKFAWTFDELVKELPSAKHKTVRSVLAGIAVESRSDGSWRLKDDYNIIQWDDVKMD